MTAPGSCIHYLIICDLFQLVKVRTVLELAKSAEYTVSQPWGSTSPPNWNLDRPRSLARPQFVFVLSNCTLCTFCDLWMSTIICHSLVKDSALQMDFLSARNLILMVWKAIQLPLVATLASFGNFHNFRGTQRCCLRIRVNPHSFKICSTCCNLQSIFLPLVFLDKY
jgi:hypothetical protein